MTETMTRKAVQTGILRFDNLRLSRKEISMLRGCIGRLYQEHDQIHNHREDGSLFYRYPLVQFKTVNRIPMIVAVTQEAIEILMKIFADLREIRLGERSIPISRKDFSIQDIELGFSTEMIVYKFDSLWLGLNEKNYQTYREMSDWCERKELLARMLCNNILSFAKGLDCRLAPDERISVELNIKPIITKMKGTELTGFTGMFKTNFIIPDFLGIGKSVSRGFGTVIKVF